MIFGKHPAGEKGRFDLPADIPEGQRNETLHRYACSLRGTGGGLEFAEILEAVSAAPTARGVSRRCRTVISGRWWNRRASTPRARAAPPREGCR